jgi:hypothetical protein
MGIRPWRVPDTNALSAEVFLYDTLPNGAGYAEEVAVESEQIFRRALDFVNNCAGECPTACYHCLLDYGNQLYHPMLDRHLAADLSRYVLDGTLTTLNPRIAQGALERLMPFAREMEYSFDLTSTGTPFVRVRNPAVGRWLGLIPTHTFRPEDNTLIVELRDLHISPVCITHFDLIRRPLWVWNKLMPTLLGQADISVIL